MRSNVKVSALTPPAGVTDGFDVDVDGGAALRRLLTAIKRCHTALIVRPSIKTQTFCVPDVTHTHTHTQTHTHTHTHTEIN